MTLHKHYRKIVAREQKELVLNKPQGFTLIEILIVIGIIAVLAGIVIIAINPAKQFAQARDTQRQSNIEAILNGIGQRMADNMGVFGGSFGSVPYECPSLTITDVTSTIYTDNQVGGGDPNGVYLGCLVPTYLASFPIDPSLNPSGDNTGYTLYLDDAGRITVCAPDAMKESSIPDSSKTPLCVKR